MRRIDGFGSGQRGFKRLSIVRMIAVITTGLYAGIIFGDRQ